MSKEQLITSSHCLLLKPRGSDNAVSKFMHLRDVSPLRDSAKVHFLINMAQYCDNGPKLTEEAVEDNTHDDMWREDPNQMNNHFRTILQSVEKIWIILGWYFMTTTGFSSNQESNYLTCSWATFATIPDVVSELQLDVINPVDECWLCVSANQGYVERLFMLHLTMLCSGLV